jgi:transposase InsO family protein
MSHTRDRPYHPMTQSKIERYHGSMKNQTLLENCYLPGQLEQRLAEFVVHYNNRRYHESLDNLKPAVRLQLHALAYNRANFMRTLALPEAVKQWSLTSLREKLVKIGAKVARHGRYVYSR